MISSAVLLTLAMQCAPTIHPDTSHDVARVESGLNPFAIGVVGQKKGLFPSNINDALDHIDQLKAKGKNYSVGLMQINQANFSRYGVTAKQLFNPCTNLTVFEKIITDCYLRGGTLKRALSCYYSGFESQWNENVR
ncbi:lytic transglycosylase domain-containing protein [Citrobacter braakii]